MNILFESTDGETPSEDEMRVLTQRNISWTNVLSLCKAAREIMEHSYAPYSKFNVGAAGYFETKDGLVATFVGTNIENAAYSPTTCAETSAILGAKNESFHKMSAMVVTARPEEDWVAPCGRCRQMMAEVVDPKQDAVILLYRGDGRILGVLFSELLPMAFGPWNLGIDPFET